MAARLLLITPAWRKWIGSLRMPVEKDTVAEHAELIGRVTLAWNDLNHILSILFEMLSGLPPEKAKAIYFAPPSDRAQREMLMAVAKIALEPHPSIFTAS